MNNKMSIILLCCIFSMLLLQSCAPKQKVSESTPHSFSMLFNETEAAPLRDDWLILKEYKERKNVVFDI